MTTVQAILPPPSVEKVTVEPSSVNVPKGGTQKFTATVTGANNPSPSVTWSIDEINNAAVTTINDDGVLTVSSDEALTSLTVRATSVEDKSKSDSAAVTVTVTVTNNPENNSLNDFQSELEGLESNEETNPYTITFSKDENVNISDSWESINYAVQSAGKYVILDLSACSATNNTISGASENPSGNDFNIIKNNIYIKGIILPDTLTSIGHCAFDWCMSVNSVTIPDSVSNIGDFAFLACGITSVTIQDGVTSIGASAFSGSFKSIVIPGTVTSIGELAFINCWNLMSVTFGTGSKITSFGYEAFPVRTDVMYDPNSLETAYYAADGGPGTYTREAVGAIWEKQTS